MLSLSVSIALSCQSDGDRTLTLYSQVFPACISAVGFHHKNRLRVRKRYQTIS